MKTKFTCDQLIDHDIHGWGAVVDDTAKRKIAEEDVLIELRAGGTVIAQQRRTVQRPDVDKAAGQPGVAKGYRMPVLAAAAAFAAMGQPGGLAFSMRFGGLEVDLAKQPSRLLDLGQFRSLRLCDPGGPLTIADLWFASEHELRLRIETVKASQGLMPPYKMRFFQPEFLPGTGLRMIGEMTVAGEGINVVTPFLRNPLLPLLITVSAANGDTVDMDLIPFPSLCRGGFHHAELLAAAGNAGYLHDLRVMSDSLLRDAADVTGKGTGPRIETLRIDMRGATGAERIFNPAVLQWLVLAKRLRIESAGIAPDGESGATFARAIDELSGLMPPARRASGLTLTLPADALPSLAALSCDRLTSGADGAASACSFLTAEAATGVPRWYVSVPMGGAWWQALQPGHVPALAPVLASSGSRKIEIPVATPGVSQAMAIRFVDESFRTDDTRMYPVAPDGGMVIQGEPGGTLISVVVSVRNTAQAFTDMVTSLAAQSVASRIELIIINNRSSASARVAIENAAAGLFPGRYAIIEHDAPFNHSVQTNLGVATATSAHICLIDSDVIPHDPRTLETLLLLAQNPETATAGCMLLEQRPGKPDAVRFRSAGVFPAGLIFGGRARINLVEPDCGAIFGPAVYPVAANSFALSMVRRDCWEAIGGLDPLRLGSDLNDADYCLRAMDKGFVNLCTTAVSAFHAGRASRGTAFDMMAPDMITTPNLATLLGNCTVIRRIG